MEEEIAASALIEEAPMPEGVAAPGTCVVYRLADGSEVRVKILGPWDSDGEAVISYRSPMGQGLIGSRPGSVIDVEVPGGHQQITLVSVETLDL